MTTMIYDQRKQNADAKVSHDHEQAAWDSAMHSARAVAFAHGRHYTFEECRLVLRAVHGRPTRDMADTQRDQFIRSAWADADRTLKALIRNGELVQNEDETWSRRTFHTTAWINDEFDMLTPVPQNEAAAFTERVQKLRREQSPEYKREQRMKALEAEIEALRNA